MNNHAYFQSETDKSSEVLKNPENQPRNWMHKPLKEEVEKFEKIMVDFEKSAKKVRNDLLSTWIREEKNCWGDPVQRLNTLRTSSEEEDVWPCYNCSQLGKKPKKSHY